MEDPKSGNYRRSTPASKPVKWALTKSCGLPGPYPAKQPISPVGSSHLWACRAAGLSLSRGVGRVIVKSGVLSVLGVPTTLEPRNHGALSRGTPLRKMWNTKVQEHKKVFLHLQDPGGTIWMGLEVDMLLPRLVHHTSAKVGEQGSGTLHGRAARSSLVTSWLWLIPLALQASTALLVAIAPDGRPFCM